MLIGHPPFETKSLKETYSRIRNNEYTIPPRISDSAAKLIRKMLQANPANRPSLNDILSDEFFKKGFFPNRLPASVVTTSPRWSEYERTRESNQNISKDAIKKITLALSRQMKLSTDEKEESLEKDLTEMERKGEKCSVSSSDEKDSELSGNYGTSCARDTGQEGEDL